VVLENEDYHSAQDTQETQETQVREEEVEEFQQFVSQSNVQDEDNDMKDCYEPE